MEATALISDPFAAGDMLVAADIPVDTPVTADTPVVVRYRDKWAQYGYCGPVRMY
jgi:hypothetical protein